MDDDNSTSSHLKLPGFRFHPTEEELLNFYLKSMVSGKKLRGGDIIGYLNIYNHHPWELPGLAKIGEREWFFFVPRDKKHGSGGRPNRTTENGFWKATGSDRKIVSISDPKKMIGLRKTLVFYEGRAPRGTKTDWIMNEYRLPPHNYKCSGSPQSKDIVLCKIYRKATSLKVLEQMAAMEQQQEEEEEQVPMEFNKQDMIKVIQEEERSSSKGSLMLPNDLAELQVPKFNTDWTQDSFWAQLNSPWLDNLPHFLQMY